MDAISVSGVQGTGKTTLARALGAQLDAVVFSRDPLMRVLSDGGIAIDHEAPPGTKGVGLLGYELQDALLRQQLGMGRSVVLECIAPPQIRETWRATSEECGARFWIVDTVCSDADIHRQRFEARGAPVRLGTWQLTWEVAERGRATFRPHPDAIFVADSVVSVEENVSRIMDLIMAEPG